GCALGAGDHLQHLRAFALRARPGGLGAWGLGGLGFLLGFGRLGLALGGLLARGRALLLGGNLLRGGLLRRALRALCRHGGGVVGGFGFCVLHIGSGYPFL